MWLTQTSLILAKLFCLRANPEDVPYSRVLLTLIATAYLFVKCITDIWFVDIVNNYDADILIKLSWHYALFMALMWIAVLYATVRTTLVYYAATDRLIKVLTAFLWVDLVLAVLFLVWVAALSVMTLPLQSNSFGAFGLIISFILFVYWQFRLYIHIIVHSINVTVLKASIFTLFYMLVQYNISETLINFMVTVQ